MSEPDRVKKETSPAPRRSDSSEKEGGTSRFPAEHRNSGLDVQRRVVSPDAQPTFAEQEAARSIVPVQMKGANVQKKGGDEAKATDAGAKDEGAGGKKKPTSMKVVKVMSEASSGGTKLVFNRGKTWGVEVGDVVSIGSMTLTISDIEDFRSIATTKTPVDEVEPMIKEAGANVEYGPAKVAPPPAEKKEDAESELIVKHLPIKNFRGNRKAEFTVRHVKSKPVKLEISWDGEKDRAAILTHVTEQFDIVLSSVLGGMTAAQKRQEVVKITDAIINSY